VQILLTCSMIASVGVSATAVQAQNLIWLLQFGTTNDNIASTVIPDGLGGSWVSGSTEDNLFGPNAGSFGNDAFVGRLDAAGNQTWMRQFGDLSNDSAPGLAPDGAGGAFVAGTTATSGTLGGPSLGGLSDGYVARYDASGNQLWVTRVGTDETDSIDAAASDGSGGTFVAGTFSNSSVAGRDAWLAHLDSAGNQLWFHPFDARAERPFPNAICADGGGGVFLAGQVEGDLAGPALGGGDAFVARYDGAGNRLWIRQFGTSQFDVATALAPDSIGGFFVGGLVKTAPPSADLDGWVARYDRQGNELWTRQFGTTVRDRVWGLAADGVGGVIVTGDTEGNFVGSCACGVDAILVRYDDAGNQTSIYQFGSATIDSALSITPSSPGRVVVAGYTRGSLSGSNAGKRDAFLAEFSIDFCYPDCDQSTGVGVLDIFDFLCFQNSFVGGNAYACDCDTSTGQLVCDIFDFLCFQNAFVAGCP
jgi:hypothetical protein